MYIFSTHQIGFEDEIKTVFRTNAKRRATRKSKGGRRNENKGRERTRSSTDGGEMAIEIEIAIEINVVIDEWTMIRIVMILAVIGKVFFAIKLLILIKKILVKKHLRPIFE